MNHSHHHSALIRHKQNSTMKAKVYSVRHRLMEIMCTEHHKIFRLWLIYSQLHGEQSISDRLSSAAACVCGVKMKTESRGRECINFHEAHSYKPSTKNGISNADIHVFCASFYPPYLPLPLILLQTRKLIMFWEFFKRFMRKYIKWDWNSNGGTPSRAGVLDFSDAND